VPTRSISAEFLSGLARLIVLLSVLLLGPGIAAAQESRTALVIGNGAYSFSPLTNPLNDASDVAEALKGAGFDVTLIKDAGVEQMREAVVAFGEKLTRNGGVGLFYYAGHGVQVEGENYLLAISDGLDSPDDLDTKAITAAEVVDVMTAAKNGLNIVILDACRDNPLTGGVNGLSRIDSSASLFVSYSTSPGSVALDGSGRNSPYTKHLTQSIGTPNLNLEETFKRTLKGVYQETEGQQTPWLSSSFFGEFVFRSDGKAPKPAPDAQAQPGQQSSLSRLPPPAQIATPPNVTGIYRVEGRNPNGSRYRGMVAVEQQADKFDVTWWIGRDIFRGTGELAGRMIVVNWGSTHPVVYSFGPKGKLDGEWADGSASETLDLVGAADPEAAPRPGRYVVDGRNPNGSRYQGYLDLTGSGEYYDVQWTIGRQSYRGSGRLRNGILTVDWGAASPVVYAVGADGRLFGLWENGQGAEVLTPAN